MRGMAFLFALITGSYLQAAAISSIQTGTASIATSGTTTSVNITDVNADLSAVFFTYRTSATNADDTLTYMTRTESGGDLTDIAFTRSGNPAIAVTIRYYVVTWASGVTVTDGTFSMAGTVGSASATPTFTKASSFLIFSYMTTGSAFGANNMVRGDLTGNNSVSFTRDSSTGSITGTYQVIDYSGASVQHSSIVLNTSTSNNDTITSVTTGNSFLLTSCSLSYGSTGIVQDKTVKATFSSTAVTVARAGNGGVLTCAYQVVSFSDGTTTQTGLISMANLAASGTASITSNVNYSLAIPTTMFSKNNKTSGNVTAYAVDEVSFDGTTVTGTRSDASDAKEIQVSVILFNTTASRRIFGSEGD